VDITDWLETDATEDVEIIEVVSTVEVAPVSVPVSIDAKRNSQSGVS